MKDSVQRSVKSLVTALRRTPGIAAVYLFGSYALGKATPLSDIDICIFDKGLTASKRSEIGAMASERLDLSFFDKLPVSVQMRVFKDGKALFVKDNRFLREAMNSTLKRYLDFRPILRRYYSNAHGIEI
jgi:hypothetical protein